MDDHGIAIEMDYDVILTDIGPDRMQVMKAVRALHPLNPLTPAQVRKALETLPITLVYNISHYEVTKVLSELKPLGASVKVELSEKQPTYEFIMQKKWRGSNPDR
jgi:ribosomal protein L7/L12